MAEPTGRTALKPEKALVSLIDRAIWLLPWPANGPLPDGSPLAAVALHLVGMALFTVIMGNAFAAFPVMTAAIGKPRWCSRWACWPASVGRCARRWPLTSPPFRPRCRT